MYPSTVEDRDVVIGGGVHAAIFAATRAALGYSPPIVFERNAATGGVFARLKPFMMNSINRGGIDSVGTGPSLIPARSDKDSLNRLPNSRHQVNSYLEYPMSDDMAVAVRRTLNDYASVYTSAPVTVVGRDVKTSDGIYLGMARRVIWATGLAMTPNKSPDIGGRILTAEEFLSNPGGFNFSAERVAIVGGGDSANVVAEVFLGQSPTFMYQPPERFDWYGGNGMAVTKMQWAEEVHARYMGIARHMPQGRSRGVITPYPTRGNMRQAGDVAYVNRRQYDYVIDATGFKPTAGTPRDLYKVMYDLSGDIEVARINDGRSQFKIGTAAGLTGYASVDSRFNASSAAIYAQGPLTVLFAEALGE